MADFKVSLIFAQTTSPDATWTGTQRTAGWSESWFYQSSSPDTVASLVNGSGGVAQTRAALLANTASLAFTRIQQVNPVGGNSLFNFNVTGSAGRCDLPQAALRYKVTAVDGISVRGVDLRGIPDDRVVGGAFSTTIPFTNALNKYRKSLAGFGWFGQDRAVVKRKIATITTGGLVSLQVASPYAVNDTLHITRTKQDGSGKVQRFTASVASVGPLANQFTLTYWPLGACTGGSIQKVSITFLAVDTSEPFGVIASIRKTGRPFNLYRGRASTRSA